MARPIEYDNSLARKRLGSFRSRIMGKCRNGKCEMCVEWFSSPHAFYDWAMANGYELGKRLVRINNKGEYAPDNCKFVDCDHSSGARAVKRITYNGETKTMRAFAKQFGIPKDTLNWRINNGWSVKKALSTPLRKYRGRTIMTEDEVWDNGE